MKKNEDWNVNIFRTLVFLILSGIFVIYMMTDHSYIVNGTEYYSYGAKQEVTRILDEGQSVQIIYQSDTVYAMLDSNRIIRFEGRGEILDLIME